jgi:23S rRNA pseudouridine1911/1915/1917 synthase
MFKSFSQLKGYLSIATHLRRFFLLNPGDKIRSLEIIPMAIILSPSTGQLDIIFKDEWMIMINKKSGIVVHVGNDTRGFTLVEVMLSHCALSPLCGVLKPGIDS